MPCYYPMLAWWHQGKQPQLGIKVPAGAERITLPCGKCIGCRADKAHAWALRCTLELQQHHQAVFTTLTYNPENEPPTLEKRALQLWLKRLRKRSPTKRALRFFASGEYGETNGRPHYHAIIFGLGAQHADYITDTWGQGFTTTYEATAQTIAYVAGYTTEKYTPLPGIKHERVDATTGELYTYQPAFIQMSRKPGIGGHARQWPHSWRSYAIDTNSNKMKVPRFLHEAWKAQATTEQKEQLLTEKLKHQPTLTDTTQREAAHNIAKARHALQAQKRTL